MPKPFFTKLVAISAIGFFCVLFGCIFGIATHDRLFILMSLLIGICSILRALSFYHLIHTHAYLSLDVSCTKREQTLFGKNQQYWFASDNGKEYAFSLEKNIKLQEGHRYRLYFRKPPFRQKMSRPYCITPTVLAAHFIINNLSYYYQTIVFVSASMP